MSDPFVRPDVRQFLDALAALPGPRVHELAPPEARARSAAAKELTDLPMGELAVVCDLTIPGPAGGIAARLFDTRATRAPGPAVVFYHGGGWTIGDLDVYAGVCAEMARMLDLPVLSIDYRLAPEDGWPAAPDDCEAAARWLADHPSALDGRPVTSLVLAGDSAGGNLAIVTAQALRDAPAALPAIAQLAIYPATDMSRPYDSYDLFADSGFLLTRDAMRWFDDNYAADLNHHRSSPLLASVAGLPPAVVLTASLDPIRDQGRAYAAALAQAGVPVVFREAVGNIHGFITLRRAIPSGVGDLAGALIALNAVIVEAEANRVMAQAAG